MVHLRIRLGREALPSNVKLVSLPPYSPELNPQENMWDNMREKFFHNIAFESLDGVEDKLVESCNHYEGNLAIVKSISGWNWIVSC